MRYLCLVHVDTALTEAMTPEEDKAVTRESLAYDDELRRSGHFIAANALQEPATAAIVRKRAGQVSITDGPYVETKEFLGGFILIEAKDLNEAIRIAGQIPMARYGTIEVRPSLDLMG